MKSGIEECINVLNKIASGDIYARVKVELSRELKPLGEAVNKIGEVFRELAEQSEEMAYAVATQLEVLEKLISGDVKARIKEKPTGREMIDKVNKYINKLAEVYESQVIQAKELSLAVSQFIDVLKKVGEGEPDVRAPEDFKIEALSALGKGINNAIENIRKYKESVENLLKELSTPILHAWEGVIVMPLIGTMTSYRAQEAMERLLNGIIQYRAKVAIIDITGVPVVDTMVADYLIKTVKAVKILGSEAIITGISAEVAATFVKLGIEVEKLITRNTLREGLRYAIQVIEGK